MEISVVLYRCWKTLKYTLSQEPTPAGIVFIGIEKNF
jgi:hypothetical protein